MNTHDYKQTLLNALYKPYQGCNGCHFTMAPATQIVFGEGNPNAQLLIIGEAPGQQEDLLGRPFVGRSGKLLDRILETAGSTRKDVYITNIVKIRPPNNRKPLGPEMEAGRDLLLNQIKIIRPKAICTLGASALEGLLEHPIKITQTRGKPIQWHSIAVLPTYHPAYILRNPKELPILVRDISQALELAHQ